jgi:DNA recombination protein RmuC
MFAMHSFYLGLTPTTLNATKSIYQEAAKKLYDGQDNLVRKAERLKELGAKTSKSLDKGLVDRAQNNGLGI